MNEVFVLAILLILLEARRWWGEHRILRALSRQEKQIVSASDTQILPVPEKPKEGEKDTSVIKMTAARDAQILDDEDDN